MEVVGYAASLMMGIVLGLLGGGGSIMTVPIMVYLFQVAPITATTYSLFVVGVTAAIGSFFAFRRGDVDLKVAIAFSIPSILGVGLSRSFIVPNLPPSKDLIVMGAFAIVMIAASLSMLFKKTSTQIAERSSLSRATVLAAQGFIVGMIAGFVGAGGGFLIIPALVVIARLPMKIAVGTSLFIIALQSLLGFAGDAARGISSDWTLLVAASAFATIGILIGSLVAHRVRESSLKTAFGWFVLVMGSTIFIEQFRHLSQR